MVRLGLPFIAVLFLAGVFPVSGVGAATKIVMLYNATSAYSASYVAKEEGYFDKNGLDFEFSLTTNTTMTPAALMSETVQLGGITPPMIVQANEQGLDLVVVAGGTAAPDPAGTSGMLARTGSGIKTAQDMIDRKVGVPGLGGTFDILAKKWVASKGVDFRKVTWVEVPFTRMGDTMKAGLVDVVAATLPFYARIIDAKIGYDMGDLFAGVPDGSLLAFYGTSRDWARKNPDAVKALRASLEEAVAFIADPSHTPTVQTILAKYTKLPVGAEPPPLPTTLAVHVKPNALAFWIDVAQEQGLIGKNSKPQAASFIAP
ncbi:MAG TPA: ABC transporter substrate-binding protein [Stellaceae bacterium]|jgi:NitT/TauT family transport system substrate-binding protein|nr:ABC transporter substrate-binding protein [Stellaceae bacterium]